MKTFKLKQLQIVDYESESYRTNSIPLLDGLIINREDEEQRWLVEAFTEKKYIDFFKQLKENYEELIIHVRITTELNELATCIVSPIGINEIGEKMNVLLLGTMVDQRTSQLERMLEQLVAEGNRGEVLLEKFKQNL